MSISLQKFLARATRKAVEELSEAYLSIPEERRDWKPGGTARSAGDMMAECALNNGFTSVLIETGAFPENSLIGYAEAKSQLAASGWSHLKAALDKNTEIVINTILETPDERLEDDLSLPWGKSNVSDIMLYPYWNMMYHLGQINAIGMQLEEIA